ncbi:hypothetical protein K1T71_013174 [Dendrolimus kikuchii]|uniref:Uncharacterized protein n=1 Tax=Dendrolimus kikuchii TaxID=765133 RepID=A0ACC1CJL7_9NEOP|nr:hypothetical protein K1T71_013174 [Dendrolimus kikuchii]
MKGKLRQFYTAFASGFGNLVMGMLNVWPSYTTVLYTSEDTPLSYPLSATEESLLGSLPSLGAMAGTALVGTIINKLGRRNGGIVISLPFILSWAIVSVTTSPILVLIARFLAGTAGGAFLVYNPVFVSEVAESSIRGALASSSLLLYCAGALTSYIFGWFLTYKIIIWLMLLFSVICVLLHVFVGESPTFLLRQHRDEAAKSALAFYRGVSVNNMTVLDQFSSMKEQLLPATELISVNTESETKEEEAEKEKLNIDIDIREPLKKVSSFRLLFCTPTSLKAFLVVTTLISMQVFMGMVPVQVYAKTVFTQADPSRSDLYTVIFALVLVCGSLATAAIADMAGRRFLILASSALVCGFMAALGYLLQSQVAPPWVTVLIVMLYCFSFMFGAGTVPYVLLAEVFVPEVQNLASMLIVEWVWFLNFLIIAIFPIMKGLLGMHGVFYAFACISLSNMVISFFIVPETKGLNNQQIQELLSRRKNLFLCYCLFKTIIFVLT